MNSAVIFRCCFLFLRRCCLLGSIDLFYLIQERDEEVLSTILLYFLAYFFVLPGFASSDYTNNQDLI